MTFSEKKISVQFSLASGQFEGGGNSATVEDHRVACQIDSPGGPLQSQAEIAIYGMPLQLMQQLATVGADWDQRYKNGIDILAGDDSGMNLVFSGIIFNAFVEATNVPDVALRITAAPGVYDSVQPATPISINGSADAANLLQQLAGQMGLSFENNGVTAKLASPYYYGSAWWMAQEIAQDCNITMTVERGVLAISPLNGARSGDAVQIAPGKGLVGYPTFVQNGLNLKVLFNPDIRVNGLVDVQSSLTPACGQWKVIRITHDLDTITPGGQWFSGVQCIPVSSS